MSLFDRQQRASVRIVAYWVALGVVLSSSAHAESVALTITNCRGDAEFQPVSCALTNVSEIAVQQVHYNFIAREEGRTYPWHEASGAMNVPGGIEPGETVQVVFRPSLPDTETMERMRGRNISFERKVWAEIQGRSEPLSSADAIAEQFKPCWNVGALSSEARAVTVTLNFLVSGSHVDIESIQSKTPIASDAERQAYEAARRAIVRCGSTGFAIPAGVGSGPIEATFQW